MISTTTEYFVTGGTLRRDAPCYVVRQADEELLAALRLGKFCYVLTSRQMGKSSLMVRTATQLRKESCGVAILDLTAIGQNLTAEQWYRGLLSYVGQQLELEDELLDAWREQRELSPIQRWMRAIRDVLLTRYPGPVIIFVDEIDVVRSLPFSTDEFFSAIREFYNRRSEDEELERLTFCLLGVATPSDLICDSRTTPFNIGHRIELHDFTEMEAISLAHGLACEETAAAELLKRIHHWTSGHPYLTQRLCQCLAGADPRSLAISRQSVDHLCEQFFFSPRAQEQDDNLLFVRERMLRSEVDLAGLLHLYQNVHRGKRVSDDQTDTLVNVLRLSGIVRSEAGRLHSRNRIYARVFDGEWIKQNMPDAELRRQRAAYRRGLFRATAVAALIVAVMAGLVFVALQQRNLAKGAAQRADLNAAELQVALTEARDQRQVAEEQKTEADAQRQEAIAQKSLAEQKQAEAEEQRNLALKQEEDNRWLLYASQLNLAQQALTENNFGRVRQLLLNQVPASSRTEMRGFEWYYLWQLCCGTNFARQSTADQGAISLAYSPDGETLAMSSRNHEVKILNAHTGRELKTIGGYIGLVTAVAYSPDGQWLATGDSEGAIKLWNTVTGRERVIRQNQLRGILALAFSPDGKKIASGNFDGAVRIWDIASERELVTLKGHGGQVKSIAFSPDGFKLASGSYDKTIRIWDVASQQLWVELPYPREVNCVAFSPDGTLLAAGGWGGTVSVWELATRQQRVLNAHAGNLLALAFSSDGKMIATGGQDRLAKLWSVATGQQQAIFNGFTANVTSVVFSPSGENLSVACVDGAVSQWSTTTYREVKPGKDVLTGVWTVAFSPDSKLLATGGTKNSVKVWEPDTGKQIAEFTGGSSSVAFSPNGRFLVFAARNRTVKIWDFPNRKEITTLTGLGQISALAFSPDGKRLAIGSGVGMIKLFDTVTWQPLNALQGHTGYINSIAFSPDGRRLASASNDKTIILWGATTGQPLRMLSGHTWTVNYVSFSPDGKLLASGSTDRTAKLWDVATGQELKSLKGHGNAVMAVRFSPDGKRLATSGRDNLIKLWDVNRGLELLTLSGHQKEVWSLAFSSDGRWLASGSYDGTVRLWRAATEKEVSAQINPAGKLARRE